MTELLIIGAVAFIAYTLAQSKRAGLAQSALPNTLAQNLYGRPALTTGESNGVSLPNLSAAAQAQPQTAVQATVPPAPIPSGIPIPGSVADSSGIMSGSTSLSTAVFSPTLGNPAPGVFDSVQNGVDLFQASGGITPSAGAVDKIIMSGPGYNIWQRPNGDTYQLWL